jgi:hypothetical protein
VPYWVTVKAKGLLTGFSNSEYFRITLLDCSIKNFRVEPSTITISQLGPSMSVIAQIDAPSWECKDYLMDYGHYLINASKLTIATSNA